MKFRHILLPALLLLWLAGCTADGDRGVSADIQAGDPSLSEPADDAAEESAPEDLLREHSLNDALFDPESTVLGTLIRGTGDYALYVRTEPVGTEENEILSYHLLGFTPDGAVLDIMIADEENDPDPLGQVLTWFADNENTARGVYRYFLGQDEEVPTRDGDRIFFTTASEYGEIDYAGSFDLEGNLLLNAFDYRRDHTDRVYVYQGMVEGEKLVAGDSGAQGQSAPAGPDTPQEEPAAEPEAE